MLYLPPHVAHDGVAMGDCMTISIGFRAPALATLARGMLEAAADQITARAGGDTGIYADPPIPGPALAGILSDAGIDATARSEGHTLELQSQIRISYALLRFK